MEYVTIRKHRSVSSPNSSFISTQSDYLSKSLPDLSTGNLMSEEVEELKQEIEKLKQSLQAANNEIDSLILENNTLKRLSLENEEIITRYKNICANLGSTKKSISSKKRQRRKKNMQSKLNGSCSDLGLILNDEDITTEGAEIKLNSKESFMPTSTKLVINDTNNTTEGAEINLNSTEACSQPTATRPIVTDKNDGCSTTDGACNANDGQKNIFGKSQSTFKLNPEIRIIGGQQLTGLASQLIYSRRNTKYQEFNILSSTKPHAPTELILEPRGEIEDSPRNYIILCVGENDCNPYNILIHLSIMLQSLPKTNFIVLNVLRNNFLNEKLLNNSIHNICHNFSNCKFLNISLFFKYNKISYLAECCKKINFILDMKYYKDTFLTSSNKNIFNIKSQDNNYINLAKKGTIPYYFPIVKKSIQNICNINNHLFRH